MDFESAFDDIKKEIPNLVKTFFKESREEFEHDIHEFLEYSEPKLKKYTKLLAGGEIDKNDFEWLVDGQKEILLFILLRHKEYTRIKLTALATKVIDVIIEIFFKVLKIII